jgi:dolichol-phosphate mannosyltransferase
MNTDIAILPLISITIPVLNESENIDALYVRLKSLGERMKDHCRLEFVFSDNHSSDDTWEKLVELGKADPRVRAVRFAKNVGFQRSILANYLHTRGGAVMQIDADLQDPPEMLEEFIAKWEEGYHVVYGIRRARPEGVFLHLFRRFGYWVIDVISEHPIPRDAGDFRLIDRRVVDVLVKTNSPNPYLRGMIAGLGFNQTGIVYDRSGRVAGESKFNINRLIRLGLTAVFNHSTVPLRLASMVGALVLLVSIVAAIYYVAINVTGVSLPPGFTSTQLLILFGIGLNSMLLGIIGEYLLRIYMMLRREPTAVIEKFVNFKPDEIRL